MSARNFAKFVVFAALTAILGGCAAKRDFNAPRSELTWTPYIENDGRREEIGFLKSSGDKNSSVTGAAFIKSGASYVKLGDLRQMAHKTSNIVIDLDSGAQIDVSSDGGKNLIKSAQALKFYEFKEGRIESIVYRTDGVKSLCAAFLGGEEIETRSATNYYLLEGGFFTTVLQTKMLAQKGANIALQEFIYEIADAEELEKARKFTANGGAQNLISGDIKKQGRLLFVLCNI